MPFPTRQGTQAAVRSMLDALVQERHRASLLTYGAGEPAEEPAYAWHRLADSPRLRDFRSGPSARKLVLDARMIPELRRLWRRTTPTAVVGHHVEATLAALGAGVRPLVYLAHTSLEPELPTYPLPVPRPLLGRLGRGLDVGVCRRADAVGAVSPLLATMLSRRAGVAVRHVPVPWPLPPPTLANERSTARRELGLGPADRALLYSGNLDGYQGWEVLVAALCRLAPSWPELRWLVATDSDPAPLVSAARSGGVADRLRVLPSGSERDRRRVHAGADLVVVPRRSPGGLPIKLIDALSRGAPTLAMHRAAAGLPLDGVALLVTDDDVGALAAGIRLALTAPDGLAELGSKGRRYVSRSHSAHAFRESLDSLIARALARRSQR